MSTIPVAEIFGPTLQGEGALAGRPTYFLRVGGCDFKCAWCDTGFAVNPESVRQLGRYTQDEISQRIRVHAVAHPGPHWLTISGGNPAMYDLGLVVDEWHRGGGKVTVETQGSLWKPWLGKLRQLTISPKPPSSGMTNGDAFRDFMREANFAEVPRSLKVIVFDDQDYAFAHRVHLTYPAVPFYLSVGTAMGGLSGQWVPPTYSLGRATIAGPALDDKDSLMDRWRWLAEKVASDPDMADVAIFPQTHALIWGINTRGV